MAIDLSASNANVGGEGVNTEAFSVFHNVFEICNQGPQPLCVDIQVDVPKIPEGADVPESADFGPGDPAVAFYLGVDRERTLDVDVLDPTSTDAIFLGSEECQCVGLKVRAYGFESTEALLDGASLSIDTAPGARCLVDGDADPFADLRGISFVAFCPAVPAERVDVRARTADGEPVKIGWRTTDSPDHVVLRAGPELYRFAVGAGG